MHRPFSAAAFLFPLISILRDHDAGRGSVIGIGDTSVAVKMRFTEDPDAAHGFAGSLRWSCQPAIAIVSLAPASSTTA